MKAFSFKKSIATLILVVALTVTAVVGVASAKTVKNYFGSGTKVEYGETFWGNPYAKSYALAGGHYASISTSTGKYKRTTAPSGWTKDASVSPGTLGFYRYYADAGWCSNW